MATIDKDNYLQYVKNKSPKTREFRTLLLAFLIGGLICAIGQVFREILEIYLWNLDGDAIGSIVSGIMIFFGSLLTGIGVYDKIGAVGGAGSMVPITGFANSMVSPALEFKSEGMVYGLAAKMFIIAGPIIVYGIVSSALVGIIYYVVGLFIV